MSVTQTSSNASTKHKFVPVIAPSPPSNTPKNPSKTFEVNVVQSITRDKYLKGEIRVKVRLNLIPLNRILLNHRLMIHPNTS